MMNQKMTMTELARKLNLSQSTVSNVLNQSSKYVSPEIKERILEAAGKYNFRRNRAAVQLRKGKSFTIGVLVYSPKNAYYADLISDIQNTLAHTEYSPAFAFWNTMEMRQKAIDSVLSRNVDAIITTEPDCVSKKLGIPVITFFYSNQETDYLCFDHASAICQTVDYLLENNHKQIAWCGNTRYQRYELLAKEAAERNIECSCFEFVSPGNFNMEDAGIVVDNILAVPERYRPTALIVHNDMMAIGIIRQLHMRGHRIPEDFSVIGQDNLSYARNFIPSISTVSYDGEITVGQRLAEMALKRLNEPESPLMALNMPARLIVRESSGQAKHR